MLAATGRKRGKPISRAQVGDDVAPTSLNKGRGEVLVLVLVVVFYPNVKRRLVDRLMVVRAERRTSSLNVEMCQIRQGGNVPF